MMGASPASRSEAGVNPPCMTLLGSHYSLKFLNCERWHSHVEHGVTIWTHRPQVSYRIYDIALSEIRQRHDVVNMDEARPQHTVRRREVKIAYYIPGPIVLDTLTSSLGTSFIRIDKNLLCSALAVLLFTRHFFRKLQLISIVKDPEVVTTYWKGHPGKNASKLFPSTYKLVCIRLLM